jgi:hypothetical protein
MEFFNYRYAAQWMANMKKKKRTISMVLFVFESSGGGVDFDDAFSN